MSSYALLGAVRPMTFRTVAYWGAYPDRASARAARNRISRQHPRMGRPSIIVARRFRSPFTGEHERSWHLYRVERA